MEHNKQPPHPVAAYALTVLFTCIMAVACADEPTELEKSREITARFAAELQSALQEAMAAGGPVAAISVCKDVAPQIASRLSRESGAKVSRTSLRFRNPGNAPEPWQSAVLKAFDAHNGTAPAEDYFERFGNNGARYMKPIPTGGLCLACHGEELDDSVRAVLDEEYPHDRARGYQLGDIRGAFSITWLESD